MDDMALSGVFDVRDLEIIHAGFETLPHRLVVSRETPPR